MYDEMYRLLYLIRRAEEEVARIYPSDKIKSPVHLSIGQEAVAVGACLPLKLDDVIFMSYRSHASYLAKGGDIKQMFAELYGKATGSAKGKGGSMHLIDTSHNIMGASAVVGTSIANSIGYAYGLKLQRKDSVVVSFFGDGAVDEGVFHESMNWAQLKQLPIIFICENNGYAIHTHASERQSNTDIWQRAASYNMTAERIENNDVLTIYEKVQAAAEQIRNGQSGPFFFECMTYRWKEHVGPNEDFALGYRSESEAQPWQEQDQVERIGNLLGDTVRRQIEDDVETVIRDAIAFAESSPWPDPDDLYTHVFKDS